MKFVIELDDDIQNDPLGYKIGCVVKDSDGHVVALLRWKDMSAMPKCWKGVLEWVREACEIDGGEHC